MCVCVCVSKNYLSLPILSSPPTVCSGYRILDWLQSFRHLGQYPVLLLFHVRVLRRSLRLFIRGHSQNVDEHGQLLVHADPHRHHSTITNRSRAILLHRHSSNPDRQGAAQAEGLQVQEQVFRVDPETCLNIPPQSAITAALWVCLCPPGGLRRAYHQGDKHAEQHVTTADTATPTRQRCQEWTGETFRIEVSTQFGQRRHPKGCQVFLRMVVELYSCGFVPVCVCVCVRAFVCVGVFVSLAVPLSWHMS